MKRWQKLIGFCPLVVAVGSPGSGKTKAGNVALSCTGSYPTQFYNLFTDAYNGQVASMTSIGFQADDPTEVGKAAKRFFSDGSSGSCFEQTASKCRPIFTVNEHVIKWLLHPERQRLMERVLLIKMEKRDAGFQENESAKWAGRFSSILGNVSSIVGKIIKLGQETHTEDGRKFFASCSELVAEWLNSDNDRLIKLWAGALFCARKLLHVVMNLSTCLCY